LQDQIINVEIDIGHYHYFTIHDPKERVICAASFPERVLHHAIMNICHPIFERHLIIDTYATRVGKGTYKALDRAKKYVKQYSCYCKMDVRKYFDSIPHDILFSKLEKLFKDEKLLNIFRKIIKSYQVSEGKGIPIGNLTSQYFANHYLSSVDHVAKESLGIKAYVRYMDDILFFSESKSVVKALHKDIKTNIEEDQELELKASQINYCYQGVPFLGYRLYPSKVLLNKRSKNRLITKMKLYNNLLKSGKWDERNYQQHITPLLAFSNYANVKKLRKNIISKLG
ncbi:MAG: RNA-directed DNA polymerase, partial [Candidatus Marinimicrobia bacterium]|nr:RNA-directed DNA polymerase [Candidatus Neomarinimicrobiota bacterium]